MVEFNEKVRSIMDRKEQFVTELVAIWRDRDQMHEMVDQLADTFRDDIARTCARTESELQETYIKMYPELSLKSDCGAFQEDLKKISPSHQEEFQRVLNEMRNKWKLDMEVHDIIITEMHNKNDLIHKENEEFILSLSEEFEKKLEDSFLILVNTFRFGDDFVYV